MRKLFLLATLCAIALSALAQPQFSEPHGLYDGGTLSVTITGSDPAATIRYTTDGSEPTAKSRRYVAPLTVKETTILRAAEVKGDTLSSPIATASYIFTSSVLSQPNDPAGYPSEWGQYTDLKNMWGGYDYATADYEMDPEMTGDETLRPKIVEGLKQLPILSIVTDKDNLFSHENDEETGGIYIFTGPPVGDGTGHGWTRPANVELMGGPQNHDYTGGCGLRLHGGHGRLAEKNPKHSFRLVFKEKYGKKTMKYPVFGEDEPAKFDQLVLRCHFGHSRQHWSESNREKAQYTRDVWARRMQRKIGHTAVNALYVHLFLNGMYWGLYNIAERVDDQYGKDHLGGNKEDIDVIKIEEDGGNHIEASEGDLEAWELMTETAKEVELADPDDNTAYYRLQGLNENGEKVDTLEALLDIDNFIDYMLINHYNGNDDWDHHNWYAIRRKGTDSQGFRFLCWDSESILLGVQDNMLSKDNGRKYPTGIFQNLLNNNLFTKAYYRRAKELLADGGLLGEQSVRQVWDSLYHTIDKALYDEAARWGDYRRDVHPWQSRGKLYTVDETYQQERERLLNDYFPYRSAIVLNDIQNYLERFIDVNEMDVPDSWVALKADMFHRWNDTGANAQVVEENPGAELNLKRNLNGGAVVAGFSSVAYDLFADISQYECMVIKGSGERLRILANRLEDHGDFKEIGIDLNEWDPHWDAELQALVLPLSEIRDIDTKREGTPRRDAFTHLNAIKVDSGSANVSGIWLVPAGSSTDMSAVFMENGENIKVQSSITYDLMGRPVTQGNKLQTSNFKLQSSKFNLRKGVYIKNGRKVVIR